MKRKLSAIALILAAASYAIAARQSQTAPGLATMPT